MTKGKFYCRMPLFITVYRPMTKEHKAVSKEKSFTIADEGFQFYLDINFIAL